MLPERPKFGECRLECRNLENVTSECQHSHSRLVCVQNIYQLSLFLTYTGKCRHSPCTNVEYVGGLHFLLRVSGAIKRHKDDVTFSPLLLRGVTNHGEERDKVLISRRRVNYSPPPAGLAPVFNSE
ncbi:hypothetical protein AVEN_175286-1 [Araneus ventricosus]|uniref:Uncharacterized protein n=1 Tax=Araneus ventricosus TaxID=182803 RepID=A0A4Y2TBV1_ARAVE|nr:hypothetical protein AVEN_175286-1 [Araneus ventricosus]